MTATRTRTRTWRRRGVVAVTGGLVSMGTALLGAGVSEAATITKTLNYSCNLPIVGITTIPVTLRATFPDSITAGGTVASTVASDVGVPSNVQAALPIIGATSSDLAATFRTTWSGAITGSVNGTLSVTGATPPASGPWVISAPASYPPVSAPVAGTATLTAGDIDVVLTPRTASGGLTGLGVVNSTCALIAGQDPVITRLTIAAVPAPTTTTLAPTTTVTPTAPTTPAPTTPAPTTPAPTTPAPTTPAPTTPAPTTPGSSVPASSVPPSSAATTVAPAPGPLAVTFSVNGKARLKKLGIETILGPGTLDTRLDLATGNFTGKLNLPESSTSFKLLGTLPLSATFGFETLGDVRGTLIGGVATANADANLRLSRLKLGRISLLSNACISVKPVSLALASTPGFSPITGGDVAGEFTIPKFKGCGLIGLFINLLIPGAGNTVQLSLAPKVG